MSDIVLHISKSVFFDMKEHLERCLPEEGCGLICGQENRAYKVFKLENIKHSSTEFMCDPIELINTFEVIDNNIIDLLGVYHSHPNGLEVPSKQDLDEHLYECAFLLIWSKNDHTWELNCFIREKHDYKSIKWELYE